MNPPFPHIRFPALRPALPGTLAIALAALLCAAAPARADEPALRLSARGSFDAASARVGDTVRYRLRIEWREVPAAIRLLPREALDAPGFAPAGSSALHRKTAGAGGIVNVTEFTYALIPVAPGTARVAPVALRYLNGLTGREESVRIPGAALEIAPAPVPLAERTWVRVLAALLVLPAAAFAVRSFRRRAGRRKPATAPGPAEEPVNTEVAALAKRIDTADSRVWLAEAERLCAHWLSRRLGVGDASQVRFEAALDQYLARKPALAPGADAAWSKLRDLFHEARYAGGRREPHILREACRQMNTCLQHQGEKPS